VQPRPSPLPARLSADELEAHASFIATLGDKAIWRDYDART
jgi:DNA polymerase-3 subunit epsilon